MAKIRLEKWSQVEKSVIEKWVTVTQMGYSYKICYS